jgi:hypothetical protein
MAKKLLDDKGKEVLAEDGKVIMVDNLEMWPVHLWIQTVQIHKLPLLWIM